MDSEKEIEKKIEEYQELAKKNKDIDVASLVMSDLQNRNTNTVSAGLKRWAYLISIFFPPLGLLFALKFYFDTKDDAKRVAAICVILTVAAVLLTWAIMKMIFSGSGVDLEEIQQINPQDIRDLL